MLSFRLFLQAPLPVIVRHTKPCIVANVVDYDGSFVRSVSHTSHSLLNVESKALGGSQKYGTLAVGNVKALRDKVNVAQHSYISPGKLR